MSGAKFREMKFGVTRVRVRGGADGVRYMRAEQDLQPFPERITDRLRQWALTVPERTFMARRVKLPGGGSGDWRHVSYAQAWAGARSIAQGLLDRGLDIERPVLILSENDLEHAVLALGCMLAGVPFVPCSPPYCLISQDFEKLRHVLATTTPGMVFAADAARYGRAILAALPQDVELVLNQGEIAERASTSFAKLLATPATLQVDAAMQATGPDSIVKFLFTSGSTKSPKAVINTQRMWCANQQQMSQSMPVLLEAPPVLVDWLPWNHTFGGNHNFGMVLYHGGTLYIDDGKPVPALMPETLRNLREIAPTVYFNVPTGFEAIAAAMKTDAALRKNLLSRARMFFYAGAALAQPVWDSLYESQEREIGERIVMGTGLGMTESSPFGLFVTKAHVRAGDLGLPTPGLDLKLVPLDGKTEVRYRGPNITPGYWRMPDATAQAFDEEGYFKTGDAVQWIDEADPHQGLKFDGRIAEDSAACPQTPAWSRCWPARRAGAAQRHRRCLARRCAGAYPPTTKHESTPMNIQGQAALITGGGSGLGEATARELARLGAKVALIDVNQAVADNVAADLNAAHGAGTALACACDITDTASLQAAIAKAQAAHGAARILMNIAGIGGSRRVVSKDGSPALLEDFARVINVNLIGAYNATRLFAAECSKQSAMEDGERGFVLFTASIAAFDGQIGQQAYSASKGGLVGMTLPMARDLASHGIRVNTIAPGIFDTPLLGRLAEPIRQSLAASIPFPKRLGRPQEFAQLACHMVQNGHFNGEVVRLDGALRMAPR